MGVCWVQPSYVKDVLVAWRRSLKKSMISGVWKLIPLAIWWSTWKERSGHVFLGESFIFSKFQALLFWKFVPLELCAQQILFFLVFGNDVMCKSWRA